MLHNIDISIVVPVFNSAKTLRILFSRVDQVLKARGLCYELILVDDRSDDDSWRVIKEISRANQEVKGILLDHNYGQWCATLAGMSMSSGDYIVTIDDDLEYMPEDIITLYEYIKAHEFKVVFGIAVDKYRLQGKNTWMAKGRNNILNALWGKGVTDSFKILKRELVFDDDSFIVDEHFEAFIKHRLSRSFWGYTSVKYEKRMIGASNHTFVKKTKLFFLFTVQYFSKSKRNPDWNISEICYRNEIKSA